MSIYFNTITPEKETFENNDLSGDFKNGYLKMPSFHVYKHRKTDTYFDTDVP